MKKKNWFKHASCFLRFNSSSSSMQILFSLYIFDRNWMKNYLKKEEEKKIATWTANNNENKLLANLANNNNEEVSSNNVFCCCWCYYSLLSNSFVLPSLSCFVHHNHQKKRLFCLNDNDDDDNNVDEILGLWLFYMLKWMTNSMIVSVVVHPIIAINDGKISQKEFVWGER